MISNNDEANQLINNNDYDNDIKKLDNDTLNDSVLCSPCKAKKRDNVIQWDDYFMSVAFLSSMRSKDPNTQVGACIVNTENRIVGIGYNGFPTGCSDDDLPWDRVADNELDTKYPYVCHAEVNAILNKNSADVKG
jgi:dCMP deaminase